ncbi:hypothetical protein [Limisalsivibrio acetivorans]|uniref:hypothetical protein n=1 Tax=Limisalsivibrio acetivorans TaxID=1304888 RepID=UPI00040DD3BE|nr:hypothetical protein [Limisalsivibrio acetivorans]
MLISGMAVKYCRDCGENVDAEKVSYYPGVALAVAAVFFVLVPFFGTVIGIPALFLSFIWFLRTKSVCARCKSDKIEKRRDL